MKRNLEYINNNVNNDLVREVFKGMYDDMESKGGILNPTQFGQFMTRLQAEHTLLNAASFKVMNTPKLEASSFNIKGRVLEKGTYGEGRCQVDEAEAEFGEINLNAELLRGKGSLFDEVLEDNIERKAFEQSFLSEIGKTIGSDLEYLAVYGNRAKTDDKLLKAFDGWLEKGKAYQVKSTGAGGTVDLDNTITALFDAMRYAVPKIYRPYFNQYKYYVPLEIYDAYSNYIASRQTSLGDVNLTNHPALTYKGMPVIYAPVLDDEAGREAFGNVPCVFTVPSFMWYGVYKDISMEPERSAACMRTDYYYRIRCDVTLEWADSFITGVITPDEAKEIIDENKS